MAYTQPDADQLQSTFPKFAAVDDAVIETWLTEARRDVDSSWCEDDRAMAEMLLAAHLMTLEGLGTGAEAEANAGGMAGLKSVKSGTFQFSRADSETESAAGTLGSTSYGRRYLEKLEKNRSGARVTPTGAVPQGPLYPGGQYYTGG